MIWRVPTTRPGRGLPPATRGNGGPNLSLSGISAAWFKLFRWMTGRAGRKIGAVAGRWIVGWVSDRVGSAASLMVCFGAQVVGQLTLAATGTLDVLYIGALLLGLGTGSSTTVFPAILGDIFGRAYVGAIAGFMFGIAGTAAAIGPYFGGLIREVTGSYAPAFATCAALNVIALILVGILLVRHRAGAPH